MGSELLNINIGLLGHVDSGKTSLAKCLSELCSTACFDKHPQAKERGITIDLGFSSFSIAAADKIRELGYKKIQFTLVDCPGHASLIRTIIGGAHIIDLVILVVDATKGIQTQTAECLVISQVTKKPLMAALNKIDCVEQSKRDAFIKKVSKKLEQALTDALFEDAPIIPIIAKDEYSGDRGINKLIEKLKELVFVPKRHVNEPMVLAVDHCFSIKGKGTILTGTVLQGTLCVNDDLEIPSLKEVKKVKSIQMFKHDVTKAVQGDRIGICVKHFEPTLLERGIACYPGYISLLYGIMINFNKVEYFKGAITSNSKYHISIGHETVIGKIKLFHSESTEDFSFENEYEFLERFDEEENHSVYALLELEKPVHVSPNSMVIGSKLDVSIESKSCRLAFYGDILYCIKDKNYLTTVLPLLKLYVIKEKSGVVQNVLSENEVICCKLCKKQSSIQKFLNFKVILSTGEIGFIEGSFGQRDKVRIIIPGGLKASTFELMSMKKKQKPKGMDATGTKPDKIEPIKIKLPFKRYLFDKEKKLTQNSLF